MKATHTTESAMLGALAEVNKKYDNNIIFNRFDRNGSGFNFTLRVVDSKKAGHRRGFTGRRLCSACWHVHGDYFDALLDISPEAVIISRGGPGAHIDKHGGNWQDCNIGSQIRPLYFSEACDCDN